MAPEHSSACNLQELLQPFGIEAPDLELQDLVLDSRDVAIHKGFLAVTGHQLDGRDFIPQAISLGAKVIIEETDDVNSHGQFSMREHSLIVPFYQLSSNVSKLADRFFHSPSLGLRTVAVTGTNGKTSTAHFNCQLANALGGQACFVGTLGFGMLKQLQETKNTTPDPITMQRIAWQSLAQGCTDFVYEASSHALVQGRIDQFQTRIAIFTNLTRDHLDYHGSMAEYASAKRTLLSQSGLETIVLNCNDMEHLNWVRFAPDDVQVILFGVEQQIPSDFQYCLAQDVSFSATGMAFTLVTSWGNAHIKVPLYGEFNVHNLLAAIAAQIALGHDVKDVVEASKNVTSVAGRAEFFVAKDLPDTVVDYAHTPDALAKILTSLKQHCAGKLTCVFGCGGDRDVGKRSQMGAVAEQFADRVIVTNDNNRGEAPESIAADVLAGMQHPDRVTVELTRTKAIKMAIEQGDQNDLIVVAGKGHEVWQESGTEKTRYDERQYINQLYADRVRRVTA